jgi:protein-S-isoprenylcysteine O-methyltransferase Ste14
MPKLAIVLWLLYLAISLGLRILIQLRTTGSSGFVLLRSSSSRLQLVASALFVSSLLAGLVSPVLALALPEQLLFRAMAVPTWVAALGALGYVAGVSSAFVSQLTLGRSWRIGVDASERTDLVMRGAFGIVRNPIFSALLLTSLSLAMLCSTSIAWFACAVQLLALELQVRGVEEPHLLRVHGAAYRDYAARVGRFVPGLGLGVAQVPPGGLPETEAK